jgi:hypothetical protein
LAECIAGAKLPQTIAEWRFRSAKSTQPPRDDRQFVTALARGLEILRCFSRKDRELGNGEIASRTGLARRP